MTRRPNHAHASQSRVWTNSNQVWEKNHWRHKIQIFSQCGVRRNKWTPCVAVLKPVVKIAAVHSLLYIAARQLRSCDSTAAWCQYWLKLQPHSSSTDARASDNAHPGRGGHRGPVIWMGAALWTVAVIGRLVGFRLTQLEAGMSDDFDAVEWNKQSWCMIENIKRVKMSF